MRGACSRVKTSEDEWETSIASEDEWETSIASEDEWETSSDNYRPMRDECYSMIH